MESKTIDATLVIFHGDQTHDNICLAGMVMQIKNCDCKTTFRD